MSKSSGCIILNYLHLRDINALGGANWYAGANSTNAGNNSGWLWSDPVVPGTPGAISGPASVCSSGSGYVYSIAPVTGAVSYNWTVPSGATITAGAGTTSITLDIGTATAGNISVTASGTCFTSAASTLALTFLPNVTPSVTISASPSGAICKGSGVTFTASPVNGGTPAYQWKLNGVNVGTDNSIYTVDTLANGNAVQCIMTSNAACLIQPTDTSNTVSILVNPAYSVNNPQTICPGGSYVFNGHAYTLAGTYHDTLVSISGCDSIIITQLVVSPVYAFNENHSICIGETYNWHGTDYTATGIYTANYISITGCDSIYTLNLKVNPVYAFTDYHSICDGETYNWHGTNYTTAGNYTASYTSNAGCDSVFTLILTLNPLPTITVNSPIICEGETAILTASGGNNYIWNTGSSDNPYSVSPEVTTTYSVTGTDANFCSNTAQAIVTVNELPADVNERVPEKSGEISADANTVVLDHFNNATSGVLHGTLNYVQGICGLSDAASFNNNDWIRYGYSANLRDAATIDFWIYPKSYSTPLADINWSNTATSYPGSGHVFHLDINAAGKIAMSNWPGTGLGSLVSNSSVPLNKWTRITVCWGDSTIIYFNGKIDIASPLAFRPSANGSYSIYIPKWGTANEFYLDELHISNKRRSIQEISSRNSYLHVLADVDTICENASAHIKIINPQSKIKYQLYKNGLAQGNPQTGICDTLSFSTGIMTSTSSFTIEASDTTTGCSIILDTLLTITINQLPTLVTASVLPASVCVSGQVVFSATASTGTIAWYDAATNGNEVLVLDPIIDSATTYYAEAISPEGCVSSSRTAITAAVNPDYAFSENHTICEGETYNWHGTNYTAAGNYTASYASIFGCDSIYTLNLTVNPVYSFTENHSICDGDTYNWRGTDYSTAGIIHCKLYGHLWLRQHIHIESEGKSCLCVHRKSQHL